MTPVDVWDPVVGREPFVGEGVIGIEDFENAAVFPDHRGEKVLRLSAHRVPEVVVPFLESFFVGSRQLQIPQLQPLPRKIGGQRLGIIDGFDRYRRSAARLLR